ncbi:hypothetical protein BDF14DRAFT_1789016 [Spinellus fusiger]|nr:hypothetical protein BDF14DRAFT_1789016 [Spinellus fusiger]
MLIQIKYLLILLLIQLITTVTAHRSFKVDTARRSVQRSLHKRYMPLVARKEHGFYEGYATFFHPATEGGSTGACGPHEDDNSEIVALNLGQFGDGGPASDWCFKEVLIKAGDYSTVATINDACPGCRENSLDLTPSVFSRLSKLDIGIIPIEWCIVGEQGCS